MKKIFISGIILSSMILGGCSDKISETPRMGSNSKQYIETQVISGENQKNSENGITQDLINSGNIKHEEIKHTILIDNGSKDIKDISTNIDGQITFYIKNNQLFVTQKYYENGKENYDNKYVSGNLVTGIKDIQSLKIVFYSSYGDLYSFAVDKDNMYVIGYGGVAQIIDNKLNININEIKFIDGSSQTPLSFFFKDDKFIYKVEEYSIRKTKLDINTYEVNGDISIIDNNGNKEIFDQLPSMNE